MTLEGKCFNVLKILQLVLSGIKAPQLTYLPLSPGIQPTDVTAYTHRAFNRSHSIIANTIDGGRSRPIILFRSLLILKAYINQSR